MPEPDYYKDTFITEQPESLGRGYVVHRGDGSPSGHKVGRFEDSLTAEVAARQEARIHQTRLWFSDATVADPVELVVHLGEKA